VGNLYVANLGGDTIEKFNSSGVGTVFASSGDNGSMGLAFDSAGNLYAANFSNNTIEEFSSSGVGTVFASTGLDEPIGIAIQVPEPATSSLLALGVAALLGGRRLRRQIVRCWGALGLP
jgi:DNA-binding beta-propeller fold protein YncE